MIRGRRKFIKRLFAGTAGVTLGGLMINAAPAESLKIILNNRSPETNPVFPFFKYASWYNIGDYIPKDQGGKFIQMALINSEDDEEIVNAVRNGLLEKIYGNPVNWSRYETSQIEKSVWLNRLYFLPSFARMYHITGERNYLDDMMTIIRLWIADNPRLPDSHLSTYNWRDMQVAWRSIHLSWCYYLGGDGLTKEEKELITETLKDHADILASGFGKARLNEFNHQSHGALAMLYLGILFPELDQADELKQKALIILEHHLNHAFYNDGGNVEQMFGYYPFEAHLFRDAFLLCAANGVKPPAGSIPMLNKMSGYLSAINRPDGTVPQVNDSFEMPIKTIIETINGITGKVSSDEQNTSSLFPDTQIAVLRSKKNKDWYLLANPASVIGSHAHAGRLGFELWYDNTPVIIDSGCCNYDDPDLVKWYRTTRAHNTVVIDGMTDPGTSSALLWAPARKTANVITSFTPGDKLSYITMNSPAEEPANSQVDWKRTIALVNGNFAVIRDVFEAEGFHNYEVLLHLPPSEVTHGSTDRSLIVRSEKVMEIMPAEQSAVSEVEITKGLVSVCGVSAEAPVASFIMKGSGTVRSFIVIIPSPGNTQKTKIKLREKGGSQIITVRGKDGKNTSITFNGDNVSLL